MCHSRGNEPRIFHIATAVGETFPPNACETAAGPPSLVINSAAVITLPAYTNCALHRNDRGFQLAPRHNWGLICPMTATIPPELREHLDRVFEYARGVLFRDAELERAMLTLLTPPEEQDVVMAHALGETDRERERFFDVVRVLGLLHKAWAISLVCEAWMAMARRAPGETAGQFLARARDLRASDLPDRREVVMAILTWRADGAVHNVSIARPIIRGTDETVVGLGEVIELDDGDGQAAHLLSPFDAVPEQVEIARQLLPFVLQRAGIAMVSLDMDYGSKH